MELDQERERRNDAVVAEHKTLASGEKRASRSTKGHGMSQPENQPQRAGKKGYYARQVEAEAARQGLTVEEYGVYKGDVGSAVKPINSAGGLLFLSILITLIMTVVAVLMVQVLTDGTEKPEWGQIVFAVAFGLWIVPTTWALYFKERKAARLRRQNGKTIELPTRRNSARD